MRFKDLKVGMVLKSVLEIDKLRDGQFVMVLRKNEVGFTVLASHRPDMFFVNVKPGHPDATNVHNHGPRSMIYFRELETPKKKKPKLRR